MKYFTSELLLKMNSDLEPERIKADAEWIENTRLYLEKYKYISGRISKIAYEKLGMNAFHDFQLKKFEIIHGKYWAKNPITVVLVVIGQKEEWKIIYKRVKKIEINYSETTNLYNADRVGFDTWGYCELLSVDENILSHEIIFASGASINIYFLNKSVHIKKSKNQI